jgi:hypothetical protein
LSTRRLGEKYPPEDFWHCPNWCILPNAPIETIAAQKGVQFKRKCSYMEDILEVASFQNFTKIKIKVSKINQERY